MSLLRRFPRSCVLALVLSPLAMLGVVTACSSFGGDAAAVSSDDAGPETGTAADTSIAADAGTDARADAPVAPFCTPGKYAFCEAFDDATDTPWGFTNVILDPVGAAVVERTVNYDPRSAPNALRSALIVGGKTAVAFKTFPSTLGALHIELDVRATAIPTTGYVGVVAFSKDPDTSALGLSVVDGSLVLSVADTDGGTFTYPSVPKKLSPGVWFHVVLDYNPTTGTVLASADGSTFAPTAAPILLPSDALTLFIGPTSIDGDVAAELVFDNIAVTWK